MKYTWLLIFFGFACANPIPPTGGPRDFDPPVILNTTPPNKTLNFDQSEITLEFDEYIKEENLLTQLMITPNLGSTYKYQVNRNRITLSFEEPFDSATTYTLNFREGVKDITEGNVPPNLKFVFSTGNFLDSASVNGTIRSLMTKELLEDITISLYIEGDTIDIFSGPPRYSTLSDKEGLFSIENIKNGNYLVYAIDDKNRNLKLEPRTEGYGYLINPMELNDSMPPIELHLYNLDTRPIVLQNSRPIGNNYDIKFNKALSSYRLVDPGIPLNSNLVEDNQTLRIYYTEAIQDSLALQLSVSDSLNQTLDTLVYVKYQQSSRKPDKLTSNFSLKNGPVNKLWKSTVKFNKPISSFHYDSIYFKFDSLYYIPIVDSMLVTTYSRDEFTLTMNFQQYLTTDSIFSNWASPFEFIAAAGSIISVENDSISKIAQKFSFKKPKNFGIIRGTVNTQHESYVIQLLNNSFDLIAELNAQEIINNNYQFVHIEPGNYCIRILVDANNNGAWEAGNILEFLPPEPVHLFYHANTDGKSINLRANWEQSGLDLVF
ncbi:MAG: hypothetical protein DHS20C17_22000 [Cyclobacteriaceae bacterium]|nr:MAG: hypothetical protein DHS20C17_22000 [Cyclobacteriaceae bacterium]